MRAERIREMFCMFTRKTYQIKMLTFIYNKISLISEIFTTDLGMVEREISGNNFHQAHLPYKQSSFKDMWIGIIPI